MARLATAASAAWTAFMALTVGVGCGGADAGGDPDGAGGSGAAGSGSSTAATSTSGTGGTHSSFNCDPAAEPGSIYELEAVSYDINEVDPVSMCEYRGDVMLIVNTAAV